MQTDAPVVLVTGASRGIGRAVATSFAHAGYRVALHYRGKQSLADAARTQLPGKGHALVQADLAVASEVRGLVQSTVQQLGRIDVLVNNAGIFEPHPIMDVSGEAWEAIWERTLATNLLGPASLCFSAAHQMVAQGGGRIVNISSRGAFRGEPRAPAYGASKAGLNAMSQSLAQALAPQKIYVYVVAPGWVDTEMAAPHLTGSTGEAIRRESALGRVATSQEIAKTVLFLATEAPESMTGAIVDVNGASYLRS